MIWDIKEGETEAYINMLFIKGANETWATLTAKYNQTTP